MDLKIEDIEINYDEYFALENVSLSTKEKLDKIDIIAVPKQYTKNEYYFAQETIDFIKYCRQNDKKHTYDVLADGDIKIRALHSFDLWLPVIWVASNILFPIAINIVSSYIWEKRKGHEKEETQVDVTFVVKNKKKKKMIHYKGNADKFKEIFEKIDINKM